MPVFHKPHLLLLLILSSLPLLTGCNMTSGKMHQQMGTTYYRRGQLQEAQQEFHQALADDPQNATHAHNLATAMSKQGNIVAAEQMFQKAIAIDSNYQPAYHGLAKMMSAQGRGNDALTLLQNWQQSNPTSAAPDVEMAFLQRETNDIAGAEQSLRTALQKQPNHPVAMSNLGQIMEETGRVQEAKVMYQRALSSNIEQPEVYRRLAAIKQVPKATIISVTPNYQSAQMSIPSAPLKVTPLPPYEQPLPWSAALRQQPPALPMYEAFPVIPSATLPAKK